MVQPEMTFCFKPKSRLIAREANKIQQKKTDLTLRTRSSVRNVTYM